MSDRQETYIYESPDGGDTIYRRKFGADPMNRELHKISEEKKQRDRRAQQDWLWSRIRDAAESDPALQEMLDQVVVYHQLKNSP